MYLVAIHTLIVTVFGLINTGVESGVGWESIFGIIDFLVYYTVGIPQYIAQTGAQGGAEGSWAYAIWFGTIGAVQWFMFGIVIFYVKKAIAVTTKKTQP